LLSAGRQVSQRVFSSLFMPPCLLRDRPILLHLTVIFLANRLPCLRLRPRWHAIEQHFFERPDVIGQSGRHRRRTRPPQLGRALTIGGFRDQQPLAQTRVGQHEVVIHLEQGQLIPQACFALAERVHSASDCRHPLTDIEVEPLDKGRIHGPATGRQTLLDRQLGPEHHTVRDPHETPAPVRLDDLDFLPFVKAQRERFLPLHKDFLAMAGIIERVLAQHGHEHAEETVSNAT
jgi:hypothetical protein